MRRTFTSKVSLWCALALVASVATLQAADSIRILPLVRDGRVLVSFELADGVNDDVLAAIHSGLRTTFTYDVELRLEVPAWVDRTIGSATLSSTVQYDNLTRQHTVMQMLDGRVGDVQVTEDEAVVRQWLTSFRQLPLFRTDDLEPDREYYVRVRASVRPGKAAFVFPWASGPSGQAKFTFIR